MSETAHHLAAGDYKCIIFSDGFLQADGETYGLNCIYIESGSQKMLVDTGCGNGFQPTAGQLVHNLEAEGIKRGDITTIIFDHGHIDHVAGTFDKKGQPVFPNARYIISKKEWDYIETAPGENQMQNMFFRPARQYLLPRKDRGTLVKENYEVLPGIKLVAAYGHTPGNSMVDIQSKGERLLCIGDVMHSLKEFTEPEYCAAFDVTPAEAVKTRERVLGDAAKDGTFIFATHFTFPGLGYIRKKKGVFSWEGI